MPWIQAACLLVGLVFSLDFAYKLAVQTYSGAVGDGEVVAVAALADSASRTGEQTQAAAGRGFVPVALFLTLATAALLWLFIG